MVVFATQAAMQSSAAPALEQSRRGAIKKCAGGLSHMFAGAQLW